MNVKLKWYNDPQMVGGLLIFWMPIGIYGLYKSETIDLKWKRLTYALIIGVALAFIFQYLRF